MLLFLHIPKTAGTSLRCALERAQVRERLVVLEREENFFFLPYEDHCADRIFFGHLSWSFADLVGGTASRVTVLRDPLVRCLSQATHWLDGFSEAGETDDAGRLRRILHPEKGFCWNVEHLFDRTDMPQFRALSNAQTAQLADHHVNRPDRLDGRWLELAASHIDQCALVGATDSLGSFVAELGRLIGEELQIGASNAGSRKAEDLAASLPAALRAKILRRNELDTELYQLARARAAGAAAARKPGAALPAPRFDGSAPAFERPTEFEACDEGDLRLRLCQFLIDVTEAQKRFKIVGEMFLDRLALPREAALMAGLARGESRICTNAVPGDDEAFADKAAIGPLAADASASPAAGPGAPLRLALVQARQAPAPFAQLAEDVMGAMEPGGLVVLMNALTWGGAQNLFGGVLDCAARNDIGVAMIADRHALLCARRWAWFYQALFRAKFNDLAIARIRFGSDEALEVMTDY